MKKLVLATAIAALSVSAAQAAPTVYGKIFLTVDAYSADDVTNPKFDSTKLTADRTKLNSTTSRIGVKGSEALTANTDLVYQLEYGVRVDDSEGDQFNSRDTYLGVSNKTYGTALAGRLKAIDARVDYANVTKGAVIGLDQVLATYDAPRYNNAFAYVSPTYNGLTASAMYAMDENPTATDTSRDGFGVAVQYEPAGQPFRAGAAYTQVGDFKVARVSGAFDVTPATTVGALYQNADYGTNDNESAFTVSAKHKTATPWGVYGQYDLVQNPQGKADYDKQRLVAGATYAFNKQATGHIYGAGLNHKAGNDKATDYGVGAGVEYKF